jgi:hypothetical protein
MVDNKTHKKCPKCGEIKLASEFYKCKSSYDGLQSYCKICGKNNHDIYVKDNLKKIQEYQKKYMETYYSEYYSKNKEYILNKTFQYTQTENGKKVRKKIDRKRIENGKNAEYLKYRRENDINYKLKKNLSRCINYAIKNNSKSDHTINLLGCSIEEFKQHIESQFEKGMTWGNYGTVWHLDHYVPCSYFDLSYPAQQKICFHFLNINPLKKIDNLKKNNTLPSDYLECIDFINNWIQQQKCV